MIEALAAIVFRIKDRRKDDEPVEVDRRTCKSVRAAQKGVRDSIDRLQDAVNRKEEEMK